MARRDALDGDSDETLYIELSADRSIDLMDREQWKKANPSFPKRTPERAMLRMKKNLSEDSFRREALGIWDEMSRHQAVIKKAAWLQLVDVGPADGTPPDGFGVDMSHERQISIAACWNEGESSHVEEVWAGGDPGWAIAWITERAGRKIPVFIDSMSPASAMIPDLLSHRVNVRQSTAGDMAKGCGLFEDRAKTQLLTHANQDRLNDALEGARKRQIRDAGGWGWDRSDPALPIYPIVAATLALVAAVTAKKKTGRATFA
jgi:hypothetical protein